MLKNRRYFIFTAALLIVVLLIYNILSSAPTGVDIAAVPQGIVIADPSHEIENLKNHIEQLNIKHTSHQNQINAMKEQIFDLMNQLKNAKQESQTGKISKSGQGIVSEGDDEILVDKEVIHPAIGSSFQLIDEEDIIYPILSISNDGVSDTPNSPNSKIVHDFNDDVVIYEIDNGIIHGNPLLINKCMNALTQDHEINILSSISYYHNHFVPWFWSRESIGSVLQNQRFISQSKVLASDTFDNSSNAIYIKIDNSASQIMEDTLLKSQHILQEIKVSPNVRVQSQCGFTFVQHPITRFIAGIVCILIVVIYG